MCFVIVISYFLSRKKMTSLAFTTNYNQPQVVHVHFNVLFFFNYRSFSPTIIQRNPPEKISFFVP